MTTTETTSRNINISAKPGMKLPGFTDITANFALTIDISYVMESLIDNRKPINRVRIPPNSVRAAINLVRMTGNPWQMTSRASQDTGNPWQMTKNPWQNIENLILNTFRAL